MATAVMQPLQAMSLDREIMAPSPISNNQKSRHGRSKHGGSFSNNRKTRQRGYSIVDERDATVMRALIKLLKRTAEEVDESEQTERLVVDAEGCINCEQVLNNLSNLEVTFTELKTLVSSPSSKSRFGLKPTSEDIESDLASDYLVFLNGPSASSTTSPTSTTELQILTSSTLDLPDLVVYETSYANYPLILASGGIKRAGGQAYLSFASIAVSDDGTESRTSTTKDDADVCIYMDLVATMNSNPGIKWYRNENGMIVSEGDEEGVISKRCWKKAVARRADIGVLFEGGEIRREVPAGLRGKGGKGKKGSGKANKGWNGKDLRERSEDEQESNEE